MDMRTFDSHIMGIEKDVDYTMYILNYFTSFSFHHREIFDRALQGLNTLLNIDARYTHAPQKLWPTAHRIMSLDRIHTKIEGVREKILKKACPPYFSNKIRNRILPPLSMRIESIKQFLFEKQRLPLSTGLKRDAYYQEIQGALQLQNPGEISKVETEYVHLVGNHLNAEEIKPIDIKIYEGSYPIYSLSSWMHVLSLFHKQGNASEQITSMKLINILKRAESLILKTSYALTHLSYASAENQADLEKAYLTHIEKAYDPNIFPASLAIAKGEFFNKYNLDSPFAIPKRVIYNEIVWEILESIDKIEEGQPLVFDLGTKEHCLIIEVACYRRNLFEETKNYEYKIFNTGYGLLEHHNVNEAKTMAYPLVFRDVPKTALNYPFFSELVQLALYEDSINKFYRHHETFLVDKAGGTQMRSMGKLYPIQKLGICCYSAMEAWICSYFNESEIKRLETVKIKMSTQKQEKVIEILTSGQKKGAASKKRKATQDPPNAPPAKKLKDSKQLLELGKKLLIQTQKPGS
jgi:hypothetical protein